MLSEAKHLSAHRERPFAEFTLERSEGLRVTIHSRSCLLKFIIGGRAKRERICRLVKNPTENISSEFLRNEVEERVKTVFIKFFFSAMEYLKGRDIVPIRVREKRICQAIFRAFGSPVQSPGNYLLIRDYAIPGDLQTVV